VPKYEYESLPPQKPTVQIKNAKFLRYKSFAYITPMRRVYVHQIFFCKWFELINYVKQRAREREKNE